MMHAAFNLVAAIVLTCLLSACHTILDDGELSSLAPAAPTLALLPPVLATPSLEPVPDHHESSRSIEQLLRASQHPIAQAIADSERIVLSMQQNRGLTFALPTPAKDEYLWIALRCTRSVPLTLLVFDVEQRVTHMYSLAQCPLVDFVGGPLDATSLTGILTIPPGSAVHLTVIAAKIATADDRPNSPYPRNFLR